MPFLSLEKLKLKALLQKYRLKADKIIEDRFLPGGARNRLEEASLYALRNGGKRFRPMIVLSVAEALGNDADVSQAALSVELFHTASLIADDLPCMDDDSLRRNQPSVHKLYGQDIALLASFALIGEGYQAVLKNKKLAESCFADGEIRGTMAIESLAYNNGLSGAPEGQFLDLYPPEEPDKQSLDEIFYQKTVIFFETAFLFGWLFGGGDLSLCSEVKEAARHFGMAFQIYDDFHDYEEDKAKGKKINYPVLLGKKKAAFFLKEHTNRCRELLQKSGLHLQALRAVLQFLDSSVERI